MELFDKAKGFFTAPRKEWEAISLNAEKHTDVLRNYLLLLALIPAAAQFIGWGLVGFSGEGVRIGGAGLGLNYALREYISIIIRVYITAAAFFLLAPLFSAARDFDKAFQLSAYCYTAMCVGGVFYVFPPLSFLAGLGALYSLRLLWLGVKPLMGLPAEKVPGYFIASLLCMVVIYLAGGLLIRPLFGLGI